MDTQVSSQHRRARAANHFHLFHTKSETRRNSQSHFGNFCFEIKFTEMKVLRRQKEKFPTGSHESIEDR